MAAQSPNSSRGLWRFGVQRLPLWRLESNACRLFIDLDAAATKNVRVNSFRNQIFLKNRISEQIEMRPMKSVNTVNPWYSGGTRITTNSPLK